MAQALRHLRRKRGAGGAFTRQPPAAAQVHPAHFKIKISHATEKGQLTCTVQVFSIAPGLHLVDWRRGQGDLMAYYKFYKEQRDQLGELISSQNADA